MLQKRRKPSLWNNTAKSLAVLLKSRSSKPVKTKELFVEPKSKSFWIILWFALQLAACDDRIPLKFSVLPAVLTETAGTESFHQTQKSGSFKVELEGSFERVVKSGQTVQLEANCDGVLKGPIFVWEIRKYGIRRVTTQNIINLELPKIKQCAEDLTVDLHIEDEFQRVASNSLTVRVRKIWCTYQKKTGGLTSDNITKVALGSFGKVWVGTDAGLFALKEGVFRKFYPLQNEKLDYVNALTVAPEFKRGSDSVYFSLCSKKGKNCSGLLRMKEAFDHELPAWTFFVTNGFRKLNQFNVLVNDDVNTVALANEGIALVGSKGGGVVKFSVHQPVQYWSQIQGHNVSDIIVNFQGSTLVATENGTFFGGKGLYWSDKKTNSGRWISPYNLSAFPSGNLATLAADRTNLYVGFKGQRGVGGFARLLYTPKTRPEKGRWMLVSQQSHPDLSSNNIKKLTIGKKRTYIFRHKELSRKQVWVGTDKGLNLFTPKLSLKNQGTIESAQFKSAVIKNKGGLQSDDINDMVYDEKNDILWIATQGGGLTRLHTSLLD